MCIRDRLTAIRCDLDLDAAPQTLRLQPPDEQRLRELYTRLDFHRWLDALDGEAEVDRTTAASEARADYETVLSQERLDSWFARLEQAGVFAFDTETTSLDYMAARIVGVSFAVTAGEAAYVPLAHDYPGAPQQLEREAVLNKLRPLLENRDILKIGHNIKYDRNVLINHEITLNGIAYDSMLESYILDSTATRHDMDSVALKYLGHTNIKFEEVAG
mgnify:CR=1 FL=1